MQETEEMQVRYLGQEEPLDEGTAPHSSILAWRIPMDRGAWRATVQWVAQSGTRLKRLTTQQELQPTRFLCPWNFPGKNTGVGQPYSSSGDLTEKLNPGLLHWQQILYHLSTTEARGTWIKQRKNINLQGKIKPKIKIINYT